LNKQIQLDAQMEDKCVHCSERERKAMESERAANKYKQVEYMQQFLGDTFEGVISGVAQFGFFVETIAHKCEGMVSIRDLNLFDEFVLNVEDYALVGRRSKKRFRMGDHVTVQVAAASLEKRQLDFHWVPDAQQPNKAVGRKK
jgi:ribonuclease R